MALTIRLTKNDEKLIEKLKEMTLEDYNELHQLIDLT